MKTEFKGLLRLASVGFVVGLGGCIVLGDGGATPEDAACVVDYDECVGLGLDDSICDAIYDACAGAEGGTGDDDGSDPSCWDEVQQCLEESDGDEMQCADVIDACTDPEPPPGDDGDTCWDEVEQCYDTNPDSSECEGLAEMCLGGGDGGPDPDGGEPGGGCEDILAMCTDDTGEISDDCWAAYEMCVEGGSEPPPCDEADGCCGDDGCCSEQYQNCTAAGMDDMECEYQYQQCVGGGDPTTGGSTMDVCQDLYQHCSTLMIDSTICENVIDPCGNEMCQMSFFECMGVDGADPQSIWEVDPMTAIACYNDLSSCV